MLSLYNSLSRSVEQFTPLHPPVVTLYTCGITAYDYPHIGNGRKYVNDDILRRALTAFGYTVNHVQNVTDVGHLVSDADEGEDKLEKGARKAGKTVWEVAKFFEEYFYNDLKTLNILMPTTVCRATEHIAEQIALIEKLFERGYAYDTSEAVYFDVTKFKDYGKLFGQSLDEKAVAVRADVKTGEHKKHPADFALWFKRTGRFADHTMHWDSPWGDGFPGWHIECSAMSMKYLGETIDIHTGGIDHLPVHHPNEIAQSESATGKQFVRVWMHHNFLNVEGAKMSKSLGNFYRVEDVEKKGYDALDLRYLYLTTHYRKVLNFTWEGLKSARFARDKLMNMVRQLRSGDIYGAQNKDAINRVTTSQRTTLSPEKLSKIRVFQDAFSSAIGNDLNMPQALSVVWETIKSNVPSEDKYDLLVVFDEVLGLGLVNNYELQITNETPDDIQKLVEKRNHLRVEKKWEEADRVRVQVEEKGWLIEDLPEGNRITRIAKSEKLIVNSEKVISN